MALDPWLDGTDALAALDDAHAAAWEVVDTELLTLCRDRIAMLLRHEPTLADCSDARLAELSDWPNPARFSDLERAALAFTEQYVIDVASLTDQHAAPLRDELGDDGLATFVNAVLVLEQRMTLELALTGALGAP